MKLRLFLVFVLIYIVAVFGWWLYSFINYTKKEYQLEYNNLQLNSFVIHNHINEFIDKHQYSETEPPYKTYQREIVRIQFLHDSLNKAYNVKTKLAIKDSNSILYNLIKVNIDPEEFKSIEKTFIKKQRAFYSEVIFFTILVISGVIWVFGKLESLLNLNKMQNNFLLSVTHELKTPLTAIKLSSQTLQHRKIDADIQNNLIQQIVNNSDRLNELLDNVLLATRIDGKSYNYNMGMLDLTELIHKTADLVLCQPSFSGQFIFHEQERRIVGDEISLKLVFSNLFQNAVKYAGQNSIISVAYVFENGQLGVTVSDNGNSIDPKEYKSIFLKFYRVGDENTRENKGTGLGLFLVKQILKSHNANIRAEANIPKGTTFYITFK